MTVPTHDDIVQRLQAAVARLNETDQYLLLNDLNERTVSHRLAIHIQAEFQNWDVDCEYNRHDGRPKELRIPQDEPVGWDDTDARTVFPDIIVHRRGPRGPNVLVVELKKAGSAITYDLEKLDAYKRDLNYISAALVRLHTGNRAPRAEVEQWC